MDYKDLGSSLFFEIPWSDLKYYDTYPNYIFNYDEFN